MTTFKKVIVDCDGTKYYFPDEKEGRENLPAVTTLKQIQEFLVSENEKITNEDAFVIYGIEFRQNEYNTPLNTIATRVGKPINKPFTISITSNNSNGKF